MSRLTRPPIRTLAALCIAAWLAIATPLHADLVILQYHHVSDATPPSTSTSRSLFQAQLDLIAAQRLEVVALDEGTRAAIRGDLTNRQQIAITFDDAYSSVLSHAAPRLLERGWPFTVFVNTDAVGRQGYMNWQQLTELAAKPGVLIANHSADHGHLVRRPGEAHADWRRRASNSLDRAQNALQRHLGDAPPLFAYPYGEFSAELEQLLEGRGWFGFGQHSGAVGPTSAATRLPRFPMANTYGQLATLGDKLHSRAFPVEAASLPDGVLEQNPPTLTLQLPGALSHHHMSCFASGQGRIETRWDEQSRQLTVTAPQPFHSRRFRYNCTHPTENGHYFWLSQPWLDQAQAPD
ncbi:MAG: polysaccharide deacetylase family protein [Marinobacter sp.]|uniref:polysaccharide deacetylase family protein n=1 Tax=Marinobacter sp. TaxID=50741 RepID=UPI00299F20F8|nr:polysaccharide deacetylase family protein [Marinobacter sp.]MDX1756584.1 polysaccharide deacetylase family protein [Marinobacter sp.]